MALGDGFLIGILRDIFDRGSYDDEVIHIRSRRFHVIAQHHGSALLRDDHRGFIVIEPRRDEDGILYRLVDGKVVPIPKVITLCGSTRFVDEFNRQRELLTRQGHIVLSVEIVTTQSRQDDPQHVDPDLKARLDQLHLRKIDMSDSILVLNVGGYIGESTRNEIEYAKSMKVPVEYLEEVTQ